MNLNDEERQEWLIKRKIYRNILKIHFIQFLRNTKVISNNKLHVVNLYLLTMKKFFGIFQKISKISKKKKILKKKIKIVKCQKFFKKIKNIIDTIKNPNKKITSAHAYLFYFKTLKEKVIKGIELNYYNVKKRNKQTLLLMGIRNKITLLYLYNQMRKISNLKYLDGKEKWFYKKIVLDKLIKFSKKSIKIEESYRMFMRVNYIKVMQNAMKKLSIQFIKQVKENENLKDILRLFLLKKGMKNIKKYSLIKSILLNNEAKFLLIQRNQFFYKIKQIISKRKRIDEGIDFFEKHLKQIFNVKIFRFLSQLYHNFINTHKDKLSLFYQKLILKKFKYYCVNKQQLRIKNTELTKYFYNKTYKNIILFIKNTHLFIKSNQKRKKALRYLQQKLYGKLILGLKNNLQYQKGKKEKYLKASWLYHQNQSKKIFNTLKYYKAYKANKKNEYQYIQTSHNEIIANHLIEKIIVLYSKQLHIKEETMSKEYIHKSTRGIRTILLWYNKLKTRVMLKKIKKNNVSNQNLSNGHIINNSILNTEESNQILSDFEKLKELRNKKRSAPIKLSFDNNK